MKKILPILFVLIPGLLILSTCTKLCGTANQQDSLSFVEKVKQNKIEFFSVPFDRYSGQMQELPIGIFDSGIGGLTVFTAILELDNFNNVTHELGPDGRPDFENERFIYLGDQANMPYGNYPSEQKTDFLQELVIKDVAFLLGERYWPSATTQMPRHDKPPVKAIVIACNTATAYGLEIVNTALKEWQIPVQVIGIVDVGATGAVQAIAERSDKEAIAVFATVGTCKSEGYVKAIAQKADDAGITPPIVIQQGCMGLAGAIEGDPSYIYLSEGTRTTDYRGPAVGNLIAPIDPGLVAQYDFKAKGLLGDIDQPATWQLNSVENYIRYHTASILELYHRSGSSTPISTVILGCTHFPFYENEIAESLRRLRGFHKTNGEKPYKNLILDHPCFIDPATLTAKQLYVTLADSGLLIKGRDESILRADEFYISVPNNSLPDLKLAESGGFTYDYKYGRDPGHFEWEYVKRVPMSSTNLSRSVRDKIRTRMPVVWKRLVEFSLKSPRTREIPDSSLISSTDN
jgi:glutamate racemase